MQKLSPLAAKRMQERYGTTKPTPEQLRESHEKAQERQAVEEALIRTKPILKAEIEEEKLEAQRERAKKLMNAQQGEANWNAWRRGV